MNLKEESFDEIFKDNYVRLLPADMLFVDLIDCFTSYKDNGLSVMHGLFKDKAVTERGELFIRWCLINIIKDIIRIIDVYTAIHKYIRFFIVHKHIMFSNENMPTILSMSRNPEQLLKFLERNK